MSTHASCRRVPQKYHPQLRLRYQSDGVPFETKGNFSNLFRTPTA